jgi:hypothetical protein
VVVQQSAGHAAHHRGVPLDQDGKGRFLVTIDEAAEQFTLAKPGTVPQQHGPAKLFEHPGGRIGPHVPPLTGSPARPLPFSCRTMRL